MNGFIVAAGGAPLTARNVSNLLRICFESHEVSVAEAKHRMVGLVIAGSLEPSHSLLAFCHRLREQGTLQYIDPTKCTSRESELSGTMRETFVTVDSGGILTSQQRISDKPADLNINLRLAFQRRSRALDHVGLMTYDTSEEYHSFLFALLTAPVPSSHIRLGIAQILRADKLIYHKMAERTKSGIARTQTGEYPLHEALRDARSDLALSVMLLPLPKSATKEKKHSRGTCKPQRSMPYGNTPEGGHKKNYYGRGKSTEKGNTRMPKELLGCHSADKDGKPICYNANLSGCDRAELGGECSKGRHICCYCYGEHSLNDCYGALWRAVPKQVAKA